MLCAPREEGALGDLSMAPSLCQGPDVLSVAVINLRTLYTESLSPVSEPPNLGWFGDPPTHKMNLDPRLSK